MPEEDDGYSFYELTLLRIPPTKPGEFSISTAAIMSCHLCGRTINGMGGGGHYICVPCGDWLQSPAAQGCLTHTQE